MSIGWAGLKRDGTVSQFTPRVNGVSFHHQGCVRVWWTFGAIIPRRGTSSHHVLGNPSSTVVRYHHFGYQRVSTEPSQRHVCHSWPWPAQEAFKFGFIQGK